MNVHDAETFVQQRREKFFSFARLRQSVLSDDTALLELALGFIFYGLLGVVMLMPFVAYPPLNVAFLLLQLPLIPVTQHRLGVLLLAIGLTQTLAVATPSYRLRAALATFGGAVCGVVTLAYVWAGVASFFQAWVAYLALAVVELYLVVRLRYKVAQEKHELAKLRAQRSDLAVRRP